MSNNPKQLDENTNTYNGIKLSRSRGGSTRKFGACWMRDVNIEITLNPELDVQNSDDEQRVYDAFFEVYKKNKRWPRTKKISDHLETSNQGWVKKCMVKLVDKGHLACYTETWADTSRCRRRVWVSCAEAKRLIALRETPRAGEH